MRSLLTATAFGCAWGIFAKPPAAASFAANSFVSHSISVVVNHARAAVKKHDEKNIVVAFPPEPDSKAQVDIFNDLPGLFYFIADMDIDCDGVDFKCPGNPDGQPTTDFGALLAFNVPWVVVPSSFFDKVKKIPPNAISAVVCGGNVFYGIMGDTDADDPEVIGEASFLIGQTCFPHEGLNGNNAHTGLDVLYLVFTEEFPNVSRTSITNFDALRKLGDEKMTALIKSLS